ncbi:hypothetical protein [Acidithiobacillus ferridurans]|uniref:Uncharacterized protein n=1 Tax=Acidithiobacillus ferridurans TaxID=1232575 RepID=A0A8X8G9P2_ACIFI|nr:hypothetical protein [Acidithiobacillus ferridurans]MBU2715572.1 hypothetical protein [Acidithiobacillus ferridurans]MBU2722938.1 hypothetical protein [Acidithiobacillus ferridurans]MBU2728170.1 hypothetical protein [Acidithiobacillus ferridurans]
MRKIFDVYSDPGHGWVKVTRKELQSLNLEDKISTYSYQLHDSVYLEEDCDASVFIAALKKLGVTPAFREHTSSRRSRIRNYNHYRK